jgi:hypothetical protein
MPRSAKTLTAPTAKQRIATHRVFVSHATADKWLARTLCEKIESAGATTFRDDRDIDGGDDIPDSIRVAIGECHEVLVLLTPVSVSRPWVLMEVGACHAPTRLHKQFWDPGAEVCS